MRTLFFHMPAGWGAGNSRDTTWGTMVMPVGFLALADLLHRAGHDVRVLHAGIETALDSRFDPGKAVSTFNPRLVVLSLHFHHQLGAVREAVRIIKTAAPNVPIVLGGFTASFFHRDILQDWPEVDFVIRGDGEFPLMSLVSVLSSGADLRKVPNLTFRKDGGIYSTPFSYCADPAVFDSLVFSNLSLLENHQCYGGSFFCSVSGFDEYLKNRFFYLCGGRGCSVNCAYCAGSVTSQKTISSRKGILLRSPRALANDVKDLAAFGYGKFYLCFDPPRKSESPYTEFFELVESEGMKAGMIFECYRKLPSTGFVQMFASVFDKLQSELVFSPGSAVEESRKFYNGVNYGNEDLEKKLSFCEKQGVQTTVYFSLFPNETKAQVGESVEWASSLADKFGAKIVFMPIEIEPGAPWHVDPAHYGIKLTRSTFSDFVEHSVSRDFSKPVSDVGYEFPDFQPKMDMIKEKGFLQ